MHAVVFDKWEIYGHESDGGDFEYLLSGPSAHATHDSGYLKLRRRVWNSGVGRMISTHGTRYEVSEYILGDSEKLDRCLDHFSEEFMKTYKPFTLNWGRYQH